MKIALVIGHSSDKQGAETIDNISEYSFYWTLVHFSILPNAPLQHDYKVFERGDASMGYTENMKELHSDIDSWGADLSISFHFNSHTSQAMGSEVLHSGYEQSKHYAELLNYQFTQNLLGIKNRGIKEKTKNERGGGFLHLGKAPAILIEPFFGSSNQDVQYLTNNPIPFISSFENFFNQI